MFLFHFTDKINKTKILGNWYNNCDLTNYLLNISVLAKIQLKIMWVLFWKKKPKKPTKNQHCENDYTNLKILALNFKFCISGIEWEKSSFKQLPSVLRLLMALDLGGSVLVPRICLAVPGIRGVWFISDIVSLSHFNFFDFTECWRNFW